MTTATDKSDQIELQCTFFTWPLSHLGRYERQHLCILVHVKRAALAAGRVLDAAEVRKIAKYAMFGRCFIFQPVAVQTSGAMWQSTIQFLLVLGRRLVGRFQDQRECNFLFQRVSMAILIVNAFSISQSYCDYKLTYLALRVILGLLSRK